MPCKPDESVWQSFYFKKYFEIKQLKSEAVSLLKTGTIIHKDKRPFDWQIVF